MHFEHLSPAEFVQIYIYIMQIKIQCKFATLNDIAANKHRVKLQREDDSDTDFINASYIKVTVPIFASKILSLLLASVD